VEPDIVCCAKGIASGMPLGICMTKAEIMDWIPGSHASTFGGNPVAIAAAMATLDVIEREGLRNSAEVGAYMLRRMKSWPEKYGLVGDVRGRGLMIGVELVRDKKTKERAGAERDRVVEAAFEKGLLLLGCGENTVRISPPLIITKEQADIAMDILEQAIADVQRGVEPDVETPSKEIAPLSPAGSMPVGS
jgi:4-aminobutyrate aminotransferase